MHSVRNNFLALLMLLIFAAPVIAGSDPAKEDSPLGSFIAKSIGPNEDILLVTARRLFGSQSTPSPLKSEAIGTYALGCMAGGQALPITGPSWQAMRLSRHRNWALPQTISVLERLANDAKTNFGWNGLLVGDMAQPRGGPMLSGHASHQNGLDADIWFTPMPSYVMTPNERETMVPFEMVNGHYSVNPDTWTEAREKLLKTAASYPEVARIFVHPPIKAALCQWAANDKDKSWLAKIRPMPNHTFHFHLRLNCPDGMKSCKNQWKPKPEDGTGCGKELAYWMSGKAWIKPKPNPNAPPIIPKPPLTLSALPAECRAVVAAP